MRIVLTTDSDMLNERLQKILNEITSIEIAAIGKDMNEASVFVRILNPEVLIISFNRITQNVFEELSKIKKSSPHLPVIILSSYPFSQYRTQWKEAGADYVFDQAMQFGKMVDVLCNLLYKKKFETMLNKP